MHAASRTRFWAAGALALGAALLAAPTASAAVTLPGNQKLDKVDFERHIMGLFGRLGCNTGSCHGSFQGKGGFRLSLFGYAPERDYMALTRDNLGRRINPVDPDNSLLLLKATGQIEHGGGRRMGKGSWQYQIFRDWIVNGAPWQQGSGEISKVTIDPPEYAFKKPGETGQLNVKARFADGSEENITVFCDYKVNDDAIAEVNPLGGIGSRQAGDTVVVVSYRGQVLPVRLLVPLEQAAGFVYPKVPQVNYIDREVFAKLQRLNIIPSELAGDAEFLRRVSIDTIGSLPPPDEVRAFLADKDPNKRAKKIDELLAHPMHAAVWAMKFCDITGNQTLALENPQQLRTKRSQMWYDWFRKRFQDNMPYDEIVKGVLVATSRDGKAPEEWVEEVKVIDQAIATGFDSGKYADRPSLDLFWRRQQNVPVELWGEKTAAAFMGIRLECAQCHKHPFDRWTQNDYWSYANVFSQVTFGISPEAQKAVAAVNAERTKGVKNKNQVSQVKEVYVGNPRMAQNPETKAVLPPKAPGGPEIKIDRETDARAGLFEWLKSPDNPFFARSFVNRIWGHYFGVGIVDPVDNFSLANPPSNDKLLDALAKDFIDSKFDIRQIERRVLNSRTYQLSSEINASNRFDKNNFSHNYLRPMMAEVVVDVLNSALGVTESFGNDAPSGARAIEVGSSTVTNQTLAYAFRVFGRPPRASACDCERAQDPALLQKLFMMTDQNILGKLQRCRVQELVKSNKTDEEILEELFLAVLTRYPTEADKKRFAEYRSGRSDRQAAFVDTMWALINTREFILNH